MFRELFCFIVRNISLSQPRMRHATSSVVMMNLRAIAHGHHPGALIRINRSLSLIPRPLINVEFHGEKMRYFSQRTLSLAPAC
jgi:hypothetical protein